MVTLEMWQTQIVTTSIANAGGSLSLNAVVTGGGSPWTFLWTTPSGVFTGATTLSPTLSLAGAAVVAGSVLTVKLDVTNLCGVVVTTNVPITVNAAINTTILSIPAQTVAGVGPTGTTGEHLCTQTATPLGSTLPRSASQPAAAVVAQMLPPVSSLPPASADSALPTRLADWCSSSPSCSALSTLSD